MRVIYFFGVHSIGALSFLTKDHSVASFVFHVLGVQPFGTALPKDGPLFRLVVDELRDLPGLLWSPQRAVVSV